MHHLYFGSERPVTTRPRERFLNDVGNTTILQFLKNYKLEALIGIFHYAHTTMGYGAIERVSSVYLLIWVCPEWIIPLIYREITAELKSVMKKLISLLPMHLQNE